MNLSISARGGVVVGVWPVALTSTRWLSGPYRSLSSSITRLLKNEENFLFCFPGWGMNGQRWSIHFWYQTHTDTHTHERAHKHMRAHEHKTLSCRHFFGCSDISYQETAEDEMRSETKWETRHSQGPLPLPQSSSRNICGLWNLNASNHCEMTALPWTTENIRAFEVKLTALNKCKITALFMLHL